MFHPQDKTLSKTDQRIALIASVVFGVLTLGLGHLICRLFLYDRTFTFNPRKPDKSPSSEGEVPKRGLRDEDLRKKGGIFGETTEFREGSVEAQKIANLAWAQAKLGANQENPFLESVFGVNPPKKSSSANPVMTTGSIDNSSIDSEESSAVESEGSSSESEDLPQIEAHSGDVEASKSGVVEEGTNYVQVKFGEIAIRVTNTGDLCTMQADAIVNAANEQLLVTSSCGGVCKAIYLKGGSEINKECQAYLEKIGKKKVEAGHAMITGAGRMPKAKYVVHAVGPRWNINDSDSVKEAKKQALYDAYYNSCLRAHEKGLKSIIFPSIGTGIFGFPLNSAGPIAARAFKDFALNMPDSSLKDITLIAWDEGFDIFKPFFIESAN